jgi:hypothetical protein
VVRGHPALLQLAFSYLPWLHTLLGTASPALAHWADAAACSPSC